MFSIEMEIRARMEERHREAQQARVAYGLLMACRARRKAEQAEVRAERALAGGHPLFTPLFSR